MKNIPSKLFLVIGTNEEQETDFNNLEHEYVCWSQDRTDESDIEYVSLSDRDQFAIGFAEWIGLNHWWKCTDTRFPATLGLYTNKINGDFKVEDGKTAPQLLDLYKQSLTKTDKR